jgi:hypothetical protein
MPAFGQLPQQVLADETGGAGEGKQHAESASLLVGVRPGIGFVLHFHNF